MVEWRREKDLLGGGEEGGGGGRGGERVIDGDTEEC